MTAPAANVRCRPGLRIAALCVLALLAVNAGFLGIRLAGTFLPKPRIMAQVAQGFRDELISTARDPLIGPDQFSDCLSFELALVGNGSRLAEAIAPRIFDIADDRARCPHLRHYVETGASALPTIPYVRFWHGHATLAALALQFLDVAGYRQLLVMLSYFIVAAIAVVCLLRRRDLWPETAPLLFVAFVFSGIGSFGALASHTPAVLAAWSFAIVILLRSGSSAGFFLPLLAVCAGAVEGFLDMMVSVPLGLCIFLFFANLTQDRAVSRRMPGLLGFNLLLTVCWLFGLLGSLGIKLALALLLVDPAAAMGSTQGRFLLWMGFGRGVAAFDLERAALVSVVTNFWRLGYAERATGFAMALAAAGLAGWVAAIVAAYAEARESGSLEGVRRGAAAVFPALALAGWYMTFPEHTVVHAWFMVRPAIFWLAGGWSWLAGQRVAARGALRSRGPAPPGDPAGKLAVADPENY